mgnify:CR=1 FL=1
METLEIYLEMKDYYEKNNSVMSPEEFHNRFYDQTTRLKALQAIIMFDSYLDSIRGGDSDCYSSKPIKKIG